MMRLWSLVVLMVLAVAAHAVPSGPVVPIAAAVHGALSEPPTDPVAPPGSDAAQPEHSSAGAAPIDPAVEHHAAVAIEAHLEQPLTTQVWSLRTGARLVPSPVLDGLLRPPTCDARAA